ncbi:MAG: class I SAM-dependent methyltransferase [Actinomycetota bacterium]
MDLGQPPDRTAVDWAAPITAEKMYGDWSVDGEAIHAVLDRSRQPAPAGQLNDLLGELGVRPGDRLLDIGGRDATHGLALAGRYGCVVTSVDPSRTNLDRGRRLVAADPAGGLVDLVAGAIEAIPVGDHAVDTVWCRDVLTHIRDLDRALAECRRVVRPGGPLVVYQTFATEWMEPGEAARLYPALAAVPERMAPHDLEAAAGRAGYDLTTRLVVGSQWREAWEEDGTGRTGEQLLLAARMLRAQDEMLGELGHDLYRLELANALWGVYQMIGKLEPRIYVFRS